jgi:hypothetical protein
MALGKMGTAESVAAVIAIAARPGVGEEDVAVLVIADPLSTAFRADQFGALATQATSLLLLWSPLGLS